MCFVPNGASQSNLNVLRTQLLLLLYLKITIYIVVFMKIKVLRFQILSVIASLQNSSRLWFRVFSTCSNRLGAFRPLFTFLSRLNSNILFWLLFGALIILAINFCCRSEMKQPSSSVFVISCTSLFVNIILYEFGFLDVPFLSSSLKCLT